MRVVHTYIMAFCLNSLIVYIYMKLGAVHNRSPNIPETKNVLDNNNNNSNNGSNKTRPGTKTNRNGKSAENTPYTNAATAPPLQQSHGDFLFLIRVCVCVRFDRV